MPEDGIVFIRPNLTTGQNDERRDLNDEIAQYFQVELSLENARESKQVASTRDAQWDGDVPPDLDDGFDFLM